MKNLLYILLSLFLSSAVIAQKKNSPFISAHFGAYSSSSSDVRTANGIPGIVFGAGLGIPLISNIQFYNKITYVLKSDYDVKYFSSEFDIYNSVNDVNASFSQLIYNGGLQYKFNLNENLNLGIIGGLTYTLVDHEARLISGEIIQSIDNEGVFGYFGGANIENKFEDKNLSLYGEAIYNHSNRNVVHFNSPFTGMNYTFGFRYYFISD